MAAEIKKNNLQYILCYIVINLQTTFDWAKKKKKEKCIE